MNLQSAPGIPFKGKIKFGLFLSAFLMLITSCSGGGGGGNSVVAATTTHLTATATEAAIYGVAEKIYVLGSKPQQQLVSVKGAPLTGATVTAIKGDGTSAGSTTTATDGTYALLLPKNATYVIKITSGAVVMKSVNTVGTADATINVNPGTTAAVVILEKKLNTTFESGTAFSAFIADVDVNATVTAITATTDFTTTVTAVSAAVTANTNPITDTAVTSAATTAATTVSATPTLVGKWMVSSLTIGGVATPDGLETLEITANTITSTGAPCPQKSSYTTSGNTISSTVTIGGASGCQVVGATRSITYSIAGSTLSASGTDPVSNLPFTSTLTRLSPASTIVRYITDASWVAYQVGTGAWTAATSTDIGAVKAYTFDVGSTTGKFGVANACGATQNKIWQLTRGEAWDRTQMCTNAQIPVAGTVTGITGGNQAAVFIGGRWGSSQFGIVNGGSFTVGVPLTGIYDIVAGEYDPATGTVSKYLIQRDVVIAANTSGVTFNFASGVAMVSRTITVTGATGANNPWGNVEIQTKNGTWVDYPFTPNGAANLPPASAMAAGEVFLLNAGYDVSATTGANATKTLDATVDPGNTTTLDPSAVAALSGVTVSSGTHPTISGLSYTKAASSPAFTDFSLGLGGTTTGRNIELSALWLGTATTYTVPNFTGIGTWNSAWELATGVNGFDINAEMDNSPYRIWTTGGNDSPGDTDAGAGMTSNVTLKPRLNGPKSPLKRD